MGQFDNLFSGNANAPSTDPVGSYLGNLIDPATAEQYQQARAMQGLLGFFAGAGAASGPSRLPITSGSMLSQGLMNMMQQQNALPDQALKAAQTQGQITDAQYKRLQGAGLLQNMQFLNQQAQAAQQAYGGGGTSPSGANPSAAPINQSAPSLSGSYADKVTQAELGGAPNDTKNPRSSATGPGQFIDSTWLDLYRKTHPAAAQVGDDASLLALRTDPQTATGMIDAYGAENAPILAQAGVPVNHATLYGAHVLGPGGAVKVLTAPASTPLANLLSPAAMAANPNFKGKTAADFASMMSAKMGVNTASGGLPGGASAGPVGAPSGVNGLTSMPLPPGVTQQQVNAARLANSFATMRGGTPDPYLAGLGIYGLDTSKAAAEQQAKYAAEAGFAGQHALNTALGTQAAGAGPMVDAVINGVKMKIPQQQYIQMLQQNGPGAVQGGTPSTSPSPALPGSGSALPPPQSGPMMPQSRQPMEGTNLIPGGGAPGMPQRSALPPPGVPMPPSGGNAAAAASPTPAASVGPQSGGSNMPMIGEPVGPFGYSYKLPVGTGPGQDQPMEIPPSAEHPYHTTMPAYSEQTALRASDPKAFDDMSKEFRTTTAKLADTAPDIQTSMQLLNSMAQIFKTYQSGFGAEHFSEALAAMRAIGIDTSSVHDPAQMQELLKTNFAASLAKMKATGLTRWTQMELKSTSQNFAGPNMQPGANFKIITDDMGKMMQSQAFLQDWMQYRQQAPGVVDPHDFENAWYNKNPLQSFVDRAKIQVGPFKGMTDDQWKATAPKTGTAKDGTPVIQSGGKVYKLPPMSYSIVPPGGQ